MLVSHSWLQTYFKEKLPSPEKIADILTFTAFEIESITEKDGDTLIDVKVLPDRAHYCLCHRGIAGELAAALKKALVLPESPVPNASKTESLSVTIETPNDCRRYIARRVSGITVTASPLFLSKPLLSLGQRSINSVVDAANFVMFDMGQPLHAFDAAKVKGVIKVRRAIKGEKITTLDAKEVALDAETLIIADNEGPLAIAGIKGGKRAEVTETTTDIILEAANFNPALIRKTAERLQIKTDASKRFENEITAELAAKAMNNFSALLYKLNPNATFGDIVDQYLVRTPVRQFEVSNADISAKIGIEIPQEEIVAILKQLSIGVTIKNKEILSVIIPPERLDLGIPEDIVEEIGRLYGYEKVVPVALPSVSGDSKLLKTLYWEMKIRSALLLHGFSEIMTSSFAEKGEVAIEKPLALDKAYLRPNLSLAMQTSLRENSINAALWGGDHVKLFEIGKVFGKGKIETTHLSLGYWTSKKKSEDVWTAVKTSFEKNFQISIEVPKNGVLEIDLSAAIAKLPEPKRWDIEIPEGPAKTFVPFSQYPFIVRDIAVFVPLGTESDYVWSVIEKGVGTSTTLLVHHSLFDVFTKQFPDGSAKISYAFHLVFQAFDRTLTDEEINQIMNGVTEQIKTQPEWQVR